MAVVTASEEINFTSAAGLRAGPVLGLLRTGLAAARYVVPVGALR